jgi:hypothetical protein
MRISCTDNQDFQLHECEDRALLASPYRGSLSFCRSRCVRAALATLVGPALTDHAEVDNDHLGSVPDGTAYTGTEGGENAM